MQSCNQSKLIDILPFPAVHANKYSRGKVMLFVGSEQYPGAACLAAYASQRGGAGYSEVYTEPSVVPLIQSFRPSLVVRSWESAFEKGKGETPSKNPCAYVLGCGFDNHGASAKEITTTVLSKAQAPVLVDGGALAVLASKKGHRACKKRFIKGLPTVITPHAGEADYLAQAVGIISKNAAHLSLMLSLAYGAITVLKGPETYISNGEEVFTVSCGSSALAKAGTGDVLAGILGAFLAQGIAPLDASMLGVTIHAHAGTLAAKELTTISVTAEDVIEYIPKAIRFLLAESLG